MKKQKGYDAAKYEPMLNELVRLEKKGFKGIYNGDEQAIADARKHWNANVPSCWLTRCWMPTRSWQPVSR
mgnify:FL=1